MEEKVLEPNNAMIRSRGVRVGSLFYLWFVIAFVLGTAVLLFPVRWLTSALQARGASQTLENVLVIGLVLAYVVASVVIALRVNRYVCNHPRPRMRWTIVGLATMVAVLTAWSWRNPGKMLSSMAGGGDMAAVKTATGAVFEFGAYPDIERLKALKASGVTTIISLQDPNVVVEREGIAEEIRAAKEVGLELVQAPMIPWFSENTESLNKIRTIAMTGTGKYYVHCGLGRDRVNVARNLIEGLGLKTASGLGYRQALGFESRTWDFDQGSLISLDPGVWLIPFPLPEEMMGCIFEGRPGQVVVLLDSAKAPQDSMLREVHRLFPPYGVRFTVMSPNKPAEAAAVVKGMKRPVTIIAYRTPWSHDTQKGDEAAIAFANAYRPDSSWKIMTTTPTEKPKLHELTGGKEKAC
jgi:hypothetical protein